ncbi:hypothetical protein AVEN_159475-1 [Araneus ventricosus]|uniref:Uncharacterized protein n=1 Tax=Araneus ventricosus TaxID=182803 RepID=A0A4Y2A1E3_ARAVE|nr:hypothetical protein AVEN_159475-1 [Araneus ventricosus]
MRSLKKPNFSNRAFIALSDGPLLTSNLLGNRASFERNCVPGGETPEQEISAVPMIKPFSIVILFQEHSQTDCVSKYQMKMSQFQFLCSSQSPSEPTVARNGN